MEQKKKPTAFEAIQSPAFPSFVEAARAYCAFVETLTYHKQAEILENLRTQLLLLYQYALQLTPCILEEEWKGTRLPDKEYIRIFHLAGQCLPYRYYWHVFDPTNEKDTEAVCGDLVDDVADIYRDLKSSHLDFDSGIPTARNGAVWQFVFDFQNHWGDHCINAIYAIHYFLDNVRREKE